MLRRSNTHPVRRRKATLVIGSTIAASSSGAAEDPIVESEPSGGTEECGFCWNDVPVSDIVRCTCNHNVCKECLIRHMVDNKVISCAECKSELDEAYLRRITSDKIMDKFYKPIQKNRYYVELMSNMEPRMEEVRIYNEKERINNEIKKNKEILRSIKSGAESDKKESDIINTLTKLRMELGALYRQSGTKPTKKPKEAKPQYLCRCPHGECMGMIDRKTKNCILCSESACGSCEKATFPDITHTCDPNDIASVKLTRGDSKPCPNCHKVIHRDSGCPQMFCTQCKTFFNWTTLKIDTTGTFHNPHANELARQMGVNVNIWRAPRPEGEGTGGAEGTRQCPEGIVHINHMKGTLKERVLVQQIYLRISEIPGTISQKYLYDMEAVGLDARIQFIKGNESKEKFCDRYYRFDRERKRRLNIYNNLNTFYRVATDNYNHFRDIVQKDPLGKYDTTAFINHMDVMRVEFNRVIAEDVSFLGGSTTPYITSDWSRWSVRNNKTSPSNERVENGKVVIVGQRDKFDYSKLIVDELKGIIDKLKAYQNIVSTGKSGPVKKDYVDYLSKNYPYGIPPVYRERDAVHLPSTKSPPRINWSFKIPPLDQTEFEWVNRVIGTGRAGSSRGTREQSDSESEEDDDELTRVLELSRRIY